jgi:ABC-type multidrug transport system ATPase subunit
MLTPKSQVIITVGPMPANLRAQISSLAPHVAVTQNQITLTEESTNSKAELLRTLLDNGIDVRQLTERHATLEEVYLEATGT